MGISREQALDCFQSDDLVGIGMEADGVRRRLHPEGVVSYAMGCSIDCAALLGGTSEASGEVYGSIGETIEMGGTGVRLRSAVDGVDRVVIEEIEWMLRGVGERFPKIWIEGLSAAEARWIAGKNGLEQSETIARLRDAGLDSMAGGGADLAAGDGL